MNNIDQSQKILISSGVLMVFIGLLLGWVDVLVLLGKISSITLHEATRLHVNAILYGFMMIIFGVVIFWIPFRERSKKIIGIGLVFGLYCALVSMILQSIWKVNALELQGTLKNDLSYIVMSIGLCLETITIFAFVFGILKKSQIR